MRINFKYFLDIFNRPLTITFAEIYLGLKVTIAILTLLNII